MFTEPGRGLSQCDRGRQWQTWLEGALFWLAGLIGRLSPLGELTILCGMKSPGARIAVQIAKILVPLTIIGFLLWRIDAAQWNALQDQPKRFGLLLSALLMAFAVLVLSMFRWGLLVRCNGIQLSYLEALRLGSIGFLLNFVSAGSVGGDLFKAFFLARRSPGKRVEAVASVAVDRAVGLYGLVLMVATVIVFAPPRDSEEIRNVARWSATLTVAGTAVLMLLVFGGGSIDRLLRRFSPRGWFGKLVHAIADPLRIFHTHRLAFLGSIAMSVGVHLMLSVSIFLIAHGLYTDAPSLDEHLIIVPIGMLGSALPITPAGIGVLEAIMEWLYKLIPDSPTNASGTLVALCFEVVRIVLALVGVIFYWTSGREVRESLRQAKKTAGDEAEKDSKLDLATG